MGNYRFRLSDMIPNAWFYKLKNMSSRTRKHNNTSHSHSHSTKKKKPTSTSAQQKPHLSQKKDSYYFTTKPTRAAADKSCNSSSINTKASDTRFPEPPSRILSTKRTKRKAVYKPSPKAVSSSASPAAHCGCHATLDSVWTDETNPIQSPDYFGFSSETNTTDPDFHELIPSQFECHHFGASDPLDGQAPWSSSYNCRVSSSTADTIIGMKNSASTNKVHDQKQGGCDMISELELPPILTKPVKVDDDHKATHEATKFRRSSSELKGIEGHRSLTVKIVKEERSIRTQKGIQKANSNSVRKSCATSTGIRLRGNSPRLGSKKTQFCAPRKSVSSSPSSRLKPKNRCLSESFAVVKSSLDPQRDFRDSMMEMIVENNIRASKDLEDLLACYLSLNSSEYHDLIVKAFEQIWFDMADIKM